jgi:hypothetical protein
MGKLETLLHNYERYVALPWPENLAGPQKVWFAVYDETDERRLRARLGEFELATKRRGHKWAACDLTNAFADWMAKESYRETYSVANLRTTAAPTPKGILRTARHPQAALPARTVETTFAESAS